MADFNVAVALVLKHEGGYVWNRNDPGGPTKFGITQSVYSEWIKRAASPEDVQVMTVETAKDIYKQKYWSAIKGDSMQSQEVANHVLDLSVLRGVGNGVRAMQQALGQTADGVAGSKTIAALNAANAALFLNLFRCLCIKAFAAIVTGRPASLEFLNNWVRRAEEITDTVSVLWQRTCAPTGAKAPQPVPAKT